MRCLRNAIVTTAHRAGTTSDRRRTHPGQVRYPGRCTPPAIGVSDTRLILSPLVQLRRRGEEDIRTPWPEGGTVGFPWVLSGIVEHTGRLGFRGQWRPFSQSWIDWDVGQNVVWNEANVRGDHSTIFSGWIRVNLTTRGWRRF